MNIGRVYSEKGMYDSCIRYYKIALALHKKGDDKYNMASVLNNIGSAEQNINSNFPRATAYYFEALRVAETMENKYLAAVCLENISKIYGLQNNYKKGLEYGLKALKIRENLISTENLDISNLREIGNSLLNIGTIYLQTKDNNNARIYFQKAISLHVKVENTEGLAKAYSKIALTYHKDYQKQIELGLKSEKLWNQINPNHPEAIANTANIGNTYLDLLRLGDKKQVKISNNKLISQAEFYLQKAINKSAENGENADKAYYLGNLAELQAFKGDFKNAYFNFRTYQDAQDSLYSQESKNKIAGLETEREIAIRDKEILINKLALDVQRKQRMGLFLGLGLLSVIGGLLFWQNQTRKKTNITLLHLNSELDEANKIKAKFFAILSHDLRSPVANLISFLHLQKEAPDLLTEEIKERNQQKITESAEDLLENMESMLLWSKGQMDNFKPQVKQIAIKEVFEYLRKFFPSTDTIKINFENKDNLSVSTDEDYLKTIMQNLTNNAIKALKSSPNGTIHWKATQQNGQIILSITDNGAGISEQQIASLYDENALIGSKSGLGLYLIRDLTKAIACKILVKSTMGLGSEFQLVFAN
jgi:signal transduction histidine kinase/tetratricopeptide (TPR) repeat protein